MDPAAAVAIAAVALALVVGSATAANRRGGLHLSVRLWWDRATEPEPDAHGDTDGHGDTGGHGHGER